MNIISVPQQAWYKTGKLNLTLPDDWKVKVCHMAGYNRPALKPAEIKAALDKPIGSKAIRELAKGKKEVVIIFDDQTRITRPAPIVPFILEELAEGGITNRHVRFVCASGLHGAMNRSDFAKKLGEDIVSKYCVYNHHPFVPGIFAGTTKLFKTPVYVNKEVMLCDLRIAITGCVPHPGAGFGGGGKIILPGVASYETIKYHHWHPSVALNSQGAVDLMGKIDDNDFREDINQAGDLAKIDFGIAVIVNEWGDSVSIYTGTLRGSQAKAVEEAKTHYRTPKVTSMDVVISNTYAKANEASIGIEAAILAVSASGGDIVLIGNAPEGQITHYMGGPFGTITFNEETSQQWIPDNIHNVLVFNEFPHPGSSWFPEDKKILYMSKWKDVIKFLQKAHGAGTKVAVFPDATNQYFA